MEIRIIKPKKQILDWELNLTINNLKKFNKTPLLKHSKSLSIRNKRNIHIICFLDEEPVGFAILRKEKETIFIYEIHVIDLKRSKGIGTSILSYCKEYFLGANFKKISLCVNKKNYDAQRFYFKNGFVNDVSEDPTHMLLSFKLK